MKFARLCSDVFRCLKIQTSGKRPSNRSTQLRSLLKSLRDRLKTRELTLACASLGQRLPLYDGVEVLRHRAKTYVKITLAWLAPIPRRKSYLGCMTNSEQIAQAQRLAREWQPKTWDELKKGLNP